jgi:hypothetical protein
MKALTSPGRLWLWGGVILLAAAFCRADDTVPKPDSSLDVIQYKTPTGWEATDRPGQAVRSLVAPDSNVSELAVIVVMLSPAADSLDLRATFDATVKQLTSNGKVLESTEVTPTKSRQGLDAVWQTLVTQGEGDKRLYVRMIGAKVQNRMAGIYYLASSQRMYDLHQPEMDALLKSVTFKIDEAVVHDAPVGPVAPPEELLIKAKERFAAGVAARRKPRTILGDFVGVDGKPIANADFYRVFVWGTTLAGDRANYGLEVDAKGHFEQQVPDGLYQLKAICIVKYGGGRVPVDLVWLDGKQLGVNQSSAGGIVRDYCLAMSGLAAGADPKDISSFFGGEFKVTGPPYTLTEGSYSARHPGATVRLTMTPQGALVDGSRGGIMTADFDLAELNYGSQPRKVPIGVYRVTATLIDRDGGKHALQCKSASASEYAASVDIAWGCSASDQEARTNPSIDVKD